MMKISIMSAAAGNGGAKPVFPPLTVLVSGVWGVVSVQFGSVLSARRLHCCNNLNTGNANATSHRRPGVAKSNFIEILYLECRTTFGDRPVQIADDHEPGNVVAKVAAAAAASVFAVVGDEKSPRLAVAVVGWSVRSRWQRYVWYNLRGTMNCFFFDTRARK